MDNVKEDLMAHGMDMREAVDNSKNRRIWRSLVEAQQDFSRITDSCMSIFVIERTPDGGEIIGNWKKYIACFLCYRVAV